MRLRPLETPSRLDSILNSGWLFVVVTGILMFTFALVGCAPESAPIRGRTQLVQPENTIKDDVIPPDQILNVKDDKKPEFPAEIAQWVSQDGGQLQTSFAPKVDLLFVVDNSNSMTTVQDNLQRNVDRFVQGFSKNRMIDFHIGITTVWDMSPKFLENRAKNPRLAAEGMGDLRTVNTPNGEARYISRFNGFSSFLGRALKVGTLAVADGGPESETIFPALTESLKKNAPGAVNHGFLRDDALLVVIIVTDADEFDASINPAQVARQVLAAKGNQFNKVAAYFVGTRKSDPDEHKDWFLRVHPGYHPECFDAETVRKYNEGRLPGASARRIACRDGFGPDRIDKFILTLNQYSNFAGLSPASLLEKHILGIMDPRFGTRLAEIGDDITSKVLEKEVLLTRMPTVDAQGQPNVRVRYGTREELAQPYGSAQGGQIIPRGSKGWLLKTTRNRLSVVLSGQTDYDFREGGMIQIDLIPARTSLDGAQTAPSPVPAPGDQPGMDPNLPN